MPNKIQLNRIIPESLVSKRKLSAFVWKISDIGLDNNQDGIIEQSLLEKSCRNLELIFYKEQTGIIIQKNETQDLSFSFEWEINDENSSITIFSEHPLFCMKTKWSMQQTCYNELRLSYRIKLSEQLITVMMQLKGNRIRKRIHTRKFLQMILVSLFYL